jgi:hypothetical protein
MSNRLSKQVNDGIFILQGEIVKKKFHRSKTKYVYFTRDKVLFTQKYLKFYQQHTFVRKYKLIIIRIFSI